MSPLDEGDQLSMMPPEEKPDPLLCWLWLAHVLGPASPHAEQLVDWCDDPVRIWEERDTLPSGGGGAGGRPPGPEPKLHPLVLPAAGGPVPADGGPD